MPRRDSFHGAVRTALERDGWTITDGRVAWEEVGLTMLVFDPASEVILRWFR